jgi:membrane-bound lytic murein transglycosylase B
MSKLLKPKILNDIQPLRGRGVFTSGSRRVNLSYHKPFRRLPARPLKWGIALLSLWSLILGSVAAPTTTTLAANATLASADSQAERAKLEGQLKELEAQINQYESQVQSYQKQGSSLKGEVTRLNGQIQKLNLQIKAINLTLSQLDNKIADTQERITETEETLNEKKVALTNLLKSLYETDQANLIEIFLKNPKLSDFFTDVNSLTLLQANVRETIGQIASLKDDLEDQKEQFSLARADAATIRQYQLSQVKQTDQLKSQKNQLIEVTKGQEAKYQQMVKETKATAAQIRSRIFQLLGGGQLSFSQAYEYAKFAGDATGVRPALVLAVLDHESALGQNVGKCRYNQVDSRTGRQTMSPTRDQPAFLAITKELGIDPSSVMVSCAIPSDGSYGGAMGPAQFIPSTWNLYKSQIQKIVGHTPNPWNNGDAFVATALYMKNAGAANATVSQERIAAAKYYAGSNWSRFLWTYGQAVVSRANRFEEDIATING